MNQTQADGWRKEGDITADKMERINPGRERNGSAAATGNTPPASALSDTLLPHPSLITLINIMNRHLKDPHVNLADKLERKILSALL